MFRTCKTFCDVFISGSICIIICKYFQLYTFLFSIIYFACKFWKRFNHTVLKFVLADMSYQVAIYHTVCNKMYDYSVSVQ